MARGKPISLEKRNRIVGAFDSGTSQNQIAKQYGIPRQTVNDIIHRWKQFGVVDPLARSGRPKKTTPRMDRAIKFASSKARFNTPRSIGKEVGANVSPRTVARRLNEYGLRARFARRKPLLSQKNIERRLQYAKDHVENQWNGILFSDEKKWKLYGSDGRVIVRRRDGEAYHKDCIKPTIKHGGGSIMTWACFSSSGPGIIVRVAKNSTFKKEDYLEVLQNAAIPSMLLLDCDTLLHDNDPKHTAKIIKEFLLEDHEEFTQFGRKGIIKVVPHPPQSPDLNPIEHLWVVVEKKVQERRPTNLDELFEYIKEEWNNLSKETCQKYADSMKNRLVDLKKAKGFCIDY